MTPNIVKIRHNGRGFGIDSLEINGTVIHRVESADIFLNAGVTTMSITFNAVIIDVGETLPDVTKFREAWQGAMGDAVADWDKPENEGEWLTQ